MSDDLRAVLLESGPPPPSTALDLMAQVADALAALHAADLVHGDLEPADVLLREDDAGLHASLAPSGLPVGDVASDLHSLGELLWLTLTGQPAYGDALALGRPVPQLLPHDSLAVAVNRILRTSMAADPADGYPTATAMREDLRKATRLGDGPVVVAATVASDTGDVANASEDTEQQPATALPVLVLVAIAVVVLVVAIGVGLAMPQLVPFGGTGH